METQTLVEDALLLIEQNFYFLHAGEYFDAVSREVDLTEQYSPRIYKQFEGTTAYLFNPTIISDIMTEARDTPDSEATLFEYFVEFNAFRGICMAMIEAIRLESPFRDYMKEKLADRFEHFIDLVSFVRNVLSHNIHAEIRLDEKDFKGTRERIIRMRRDPDIYFSFDYATDLPEIGAPIDGYGFSCHVDFSSLEVGMPFLDIMPQIELIKLGELCFNFVVGYRISENATHKAKYLEKLTIDDTKLIDASIMNNISNKWQKVAMVIALAMKDMGETFKYIPDSFYAERIIELSASGLIQSQGNLNQMRLSEIRNANQ